MLAATHISVVELYSLKVTSTDWVEVAKFGSSGINSLEKLTDAGFTLDAINDFQICGHSGCSSGCTGGGGCTGTEEYSGFVVGRGRVSLLTDFRHLSLSTFKKHWASAKIFSNHDRFWCGGDCAGSIGYPLPAGYNKGRLHFGMNFPGHEGVCPSQLSRARRHL
jgi:hypothetical protein